jgi:hypothetical protein
MKPFTSNDEFFAAVRALIDRLEASGSTVAAAELRGGFGGLNGLTDGSASFLESIERVRRAFAKTFSREDREALDRIRAAVHRSVRRR